VLFNSFSFLVSFAGLAVAHYALPHRFRWPLLLAASLGFLCSVSRGLPRAPARHYAVTFVAGRAIARSTSERAGGLARRWSAAVLGRCSSSKYFDFFAQSIDALAVGPSLPRLNLAVAAGLSFYCFSPVSYLVDVHRRQYPTSRTSAISRSTSPSSEAAGRADRACAALPRAGPAPRGVQPGGRHRGAATDPVGAVQEGRDRRPPGLVLSTPRIGSLVCAPRRPVLATYFFAFQLYCDFSGYSDMAIAWPKSSLRLMENFRRPYLSTSVPEFWSRRWHLSLSGWFRDYLYIPIGGSRVSRFAKSPTSWPVFLASVSGTAPTGLCCLGGLNGVYTVASTMARGTLRGEGPPPAAVGCPRFGGGLLTFHLILLSWVFFRAASIGDAWTVLTRVWGRRLPADAPVGPAWDGEVLVSLCCVAVLLAVEALDEIRSVWDRLRPATGSTSAGLPTTPCPGG